jgi:glycerol-3-phosphate O-acyltransferase
MPETVILPFWAAVVLVVLAAWAILDRLLTPSVRWVMRRRADHALEDFNKKLRIRVRPFTLVHRQTLIDRLTFDEEVLKAADKRATELDKPRKLVLPEVEEYAKEIVPAFNAYIYFRLGYWLSRNISRSIYRVRLGSSDVEGLAAIDSRATVVFVMNHRSNMDYILMGYLAAEESALSYAVGEWARIWPLEQLIRAMGAYFVRRRSRNELYRSVLRSYVRMATTEGITQAVFPEGGLTRDGALQEPKLGIFDYMLRDFNPESDRDIVFVPVAVNYDRVLEDRTLLLNLDPAQRPKRGVAAVTTAAGFVWRQIWLMARQKWHRFGYACVNFGTPVSLAKFVEDREVDFRGLSKEDRFEQVGAFAQYLMGEIGDLIPVLPVALVSTVLLQEPSLGRSDLELKAEVQALMNSLEMRGANLYLPRSDREYSIEVGIRMLVLRRVLQEKEGVYRLNPGEQSLVRYYANSIAHLIPQEVNP